MPKLDLLSQVNARTGTQDSGAVSLTVKDIPIGEISIKENIRKEYTGIEDLKASIKQHGLLNPITVYRHGEGYAVKTGHRRYMSFKELYREHPDRFHSIRCIISDGDNVAVVQLIENVQREDLKPVDLYNALKELKARGLTLKQIADAIGKKEQYVKDLFTGINVIDSDKDYKNLLGSAGTTIHHFKETKGIKDKAKKVKAIKDRASGKITRRELREKIKPGTGRQAELRTDVPGLFIEIFFKDKETCRLVSGELKAVFKKHKIKNVRG